MMVQNGCSMVCGYQFFSWHSVVELRPSANRHCLFGDCYNFLSLSNSNDESHISRQRDVSMRSSMQMNGCFDVINIIGIDGEDRLNGAII